MYTFNINPNKNKHQFEDYNYIFVTLRGVFLALIIFCASFLAPYMGCSYQKLLNNDKYTRYVLLFLVIYFSINLVDPELGNKENPFMVVFKSIFVFIIFIALNNIHITSIMIVLILFALLIFTSKYYYYFKETVVNKEEYKFTQDMLFIIQMVLSICIFCILIISMFLNNNKNNRIKTLEKCIIK